MLSSPSPRLKPQRLTEGDERVNILGFTSMVAGPVASGVGIAQLYDSPPDVDSVSVYNNGPAPVAVLLAVNTAQPVDFNSGVVVLPGETASLPVSSGVTSLVAIAGGGSLNSFALLGVCALAD